MSREDIAIAESPRRFSEHKTVSIDLVSGQTDRVDNIVEESFEFFPVPNQTGNNFVALVLKDADGAQYKYPLMAVRRWCSRPLGN